MGIRNKISPGYAYYCTLTIVEWSAMAIGVSNHIHLIASATDEDSLSDILRDFKKFISKAIIETIKEVPESRREWLLNLFWYAGKNKKKIKKFQGLAGW